MRLINPLVPMRVLSSEPDATQHSGNQDIPTYRQIKQRGVLRVGYEPHRYPFAFVNGAGDLVGFDIEIANQLATDLGVELEFMPIAWNDLGKILDSGAIDLVPNVPYLTALLDLVGYSDPVLNVTAGFVVPDHRRHDFSTLEALKKQHKLRIGVAANPRFVERQLRAWLPGVDLELVELGSSEDFFTSDAHGLDILLSSAEVGTAYTLLNPAYTVVVPKPGLWRLPQGFATAKKNLSLLNYLDDWVEAHRQRGTFQRAYDHWILGEGAKQKRPRWSVVRNLLHWVD